MNYASRVLFVSAIVLLIGGAVWYTYAQTGKNDTTNSNQLTVNTSVQEKTSESVIPAAVKGAKVTTALGVTFTVSPSYLVCDDKSVAYVVLTSKGCSKKVEDSVAAVYLNGATFKSMATEQAFGDNVLDFRSSASADQWVTGLIKFSGKIGENEIFGMTAGNTFAATIRINSTFVDVLTKQYSDQQEKELVGTIVRSLSAK